eukprot:UN11443
MSNGSRKCIFLCTVSIKIRADSCDFHWLFYTLSLKRFSNKNVHIMKNFAVLHHILNYFFLKT